MAKKVKISELVALPYNPRTIGKKEMDRLKASIGRHSEIVSVKTKEEGYRLISSITVNKQGNRIVGGNQRVKALQELEQDWVHEDDISWIDVAPDSAQEKEAAISLNRDDAMGKWDDEKLSALLDEIKVEDQSGFEDLDFGTMSEMYEDDTPNGFEARSKVTKTEESETDEEPEEETTESTPSKSSGDDKPVKNKYHGEPGTEALHMPAMTPISIPTQPAAPEGDEMPALFPVSYAVTADQRKSILDAITKARDKWKLETSADALSKICDEFLKG